MKDYLYAMTLLSAMVTGGAIDGDAHWWMIAYLMLMTITLAGASIALDVKNERVPLQRKHAQNKNKSNQIIAR